MDENIKLKIKQMDKTQLELATDNNLCYLYREDFDEETLLSEVLHCFIDNELEAIPMTEFVLLSWYEHLELQEGASSGNFYWHAQTGRLIELEHSIFDGYCIGIISSKKPDELPEFVRANGLHGINLKELRRLKIVKLI